MLMELGRLVYDVEVKDVGEDRKVINNRIAIQNNKDDSTFVDVVAWDGTAELIGKYFKKGYEILIHGRLVNNKKKKEDIEYDTVSILIDKVIFTNGNPKEITLEDIPDFL